MDLRGKSVLVTGSEGFIGSHLVEKLIERGAEVKALVQYNSFNRWGWIDTLPDSIKQEIEIFLGDVREYDNIKKAVKGQEIVFHLAALIAIPYSYLSPAAYIRTNVEGTLNVMQACLDFGVSKVIHTSTSEVYGTAMYVPMDENHPLQAQSPYAASKIGADKIVESLNLSLGLPVTTIRPFNAYGPRQSARAVIPTIISQILSGMERIKLGSLFPLRDFTYVKDTAEGFVKAAESERSSGQTINLGNSSEVSIGQLAQKIMGIMNRDIVVETDEDRIRPQKSEVERLMCDNKKAAEVLGWRPQYDIDAGLKETIQWMESNFHHYKSDIYNL
ncbi:MAG TPA: NAD-dependent 4,6-dehydratase LegB [Pseudobacteroides sp.]|uniref:NAD-dependent 4,6-dehydratase LegB n=1 Tax=Pseudobacteroides sp. TaxID=1968840 RepID=UPI002F94309B